MSIARHVATVGSTTLLSRLLGFFRDVGIAAILGAGIYSDAFFAALQIPNLFRRLLGEGAVNSAFVPMWMRVREEKGVIGAGCFGAEIFGAVLLGLGTLTLLGAVFAPAVVHLVAPGFGPSDERYGWATVFVRLSIPYLAVTGLVAVAAALLNAERRVGAAAFGLVAFNGVLVIVVGALLLSGDEAGVHAGAILSAAIVAAGLAQFLIVGGALLRLPHAPRRPYFTLSPETRKFFRRLGPGLVAAGIPQLKLMVGIMVASSSPAAMSWLYYANRLYELPLGIVSITIAAVMVPAMAAGIRSGDQQAAAATQSRAFEISLSVALPSAMAFAILAEPIAGGLFERGAFGSRDTAAVAGALVAICAGLPGHVLEKVLGAISFVREDTRTPMFTALAGLAAASIGAIALFPRYGHVGVAAAIAMSGWVGATLMTLVLWRRDWLNFDRLARMRIPGIVLATAVMGGVIAVGWNFLDGIPASSQSALARAITLASLCTLGLGIYLASLQALGVVRWRDMVSSIRHRL